MAEHHTKNTSGFLKWCPTCGRNTIHLVANKRIGLCSENHVKDLDKKPYIPKDDSQGGLF